MPYSLLKYQNFTLPLCRRYPSCSGQLHQSLKNEDRKKVDRLTRKYWQLTDDAVRGHLVGEHTIGLYPLLKDETCWLLAVDFDKKTWQQDAAAFLAACRELTCQRHWNAHAQETVAMCGYSLSEQSLRQPRENLAVQSSPEPWNLATSLGWIHMTDYSPTRTRCPRAGLATSLPFRCKSFRVQTGTAFSLM